MATLNINLDNVQPLSDNLTEISLLNKTGNTLKVIRVNAAEDDFELATIAAGGVDSVNSQTGVVVLDADDISDSATINKYVTTAEKTILSNTSGTNSGDNATNSQYSGLDAAKVDKVAGKSLIDDTEISRLASMTAIFTTALKSAYDTASSWIVTNGTNVLNHLSNTSNPHSVTAAQVGLGNASNTSDADKPVSTAQQTALDLKVDENVAIIGATKTKITYDAKGLVTSGADATTSDIADSTDKRYVTDAQQVVIGNTSGTNSGDNATNSQYSGLASSKQDTLVSATNIKTINGNSILGSGDLVVAASTTVAINTQVASYTLVLADDGGLLRMNVATANDVTIPLNATEAFPVGTVIYVEQMGAGTTSIVATGGVTLNTTSVKTPYQYSVIYLMKVGTDVWNVIGGTV